MSKELDILSDIADQNNPVGNTRDKRGKNTGQGHHIYNAHKNSGKLKHIFSGVRAAQTRKQKEKKE